MADLLVKEDVEMQGKRTPLLGGLYSAIVTMNVENTTAR
jgi:hypothetical protein